MPQRFAGLNGLGKTTVASNNDVGTTPGAPQSTNSVARASHSEQGNGIPAGTQTVPAGTSPRQLNSGINPVQHATPSVGLTPGAVVPVAGLSHIQTRCNSCPPGYACPPGGCPPQGMHQGAGFQGAGHQVYGQPCTNGCCGTAGPCYPTMPPLSSFGLDPQEFLCDGGDVGPNAVYTKSDRLIGVDLEDTVVKYQTADGGIHVTPSNRVCVYAPRFASVRNVNGAVTDELATGPVAYLRTDGPSDVLADQPSSAVMVPMGPEHKALANGPDAMRARELGVPIDTVQGPMMAEEILAALVNLTLLRDGVLREADKPWLAKGADAAATWSEGIAPEVTVDNIRVSVASQDQSTEGLTTYDTPNGRLRVIKVADKQSASVGDIVTFVLRVDNVGAGPIDHVELTDNLTTRLEYVADSQTCSKGAVFSTEENDGGSLRLTWKFTDDFKVGETAMIRFRCRIR